MMLNISPQATQPYLILPSWTRSSWSNSSMDAVDAVDAVDVDVDVDVDAADVGILDAVDVDAVDVGFFTHSKQVPFLAYLACTSR